MAIGHPFMVVPRVVEIPDDRSGFWRHFVEYRQRVSFIDSVTVEPRDDAIFVKSPLAHVGKKPFPYAGLALGYKGVAILMPLIEITHDENLLGIRRPNGEIGAGVFSGNEVSAELLVKAKVAALIKKIEIVLVQQTDDRWL